MLFVKIEKKEMPWIITAWIALCSIIGYFIGRLSQILLGLGLVLFLLLIFYLIIRKLPKKAK